MMKRFVPMALGLAFAACSTDLAPPPRAEPSNTPEAKLYYACLRGSGAKTIGPDRSRKPSVLAARAMYCLFGQPHNSTEQPYARSVDEVLGDTRRFDELFTVGKPHGDRRVELTFQLYKQTAERWGVRVVRTQVRLDGNITRLDLDAEKLERPYHDLDVRSVVFVEDHLGTRLVLQLRR